MRSTFAAHVWDKLWDSHEQVKKLLTFFLPAGEGSATNKRERTENKTEPATNNRSNQRPYKTPQKVGLFLGPALFLAVMFFFQAEGLTPEAKAVLACTLWIATWWVTEAIPIPATSLLPLILFPVTGALASDVTASAYGDPNVFLFLGGFIVALAMEKWGLHKRIALLIIYFIGTSANRILLGFMLATGFLSMWISNTATAMMMVPIGTAIMYQVGKQTANREQGIGEDENYGKALMLSIAFGASIGGLATLIGTPPNLILANVVNEIYGVEISFLQWMLFGFPLSAILLVLSWVYLTRFAFKLRVNELPGGRQAIQSQRQELGKMSYEESWVLVVFLGAAFFWITRTLIWDDLIPGLNDTVIAITAGLVLFLLPARREARIIDWEIAKKLPWGILLLFGGGLAIAAGFSQTGLAEWIGNQLTIVQGVSFIFIILAVTVLVMFLTEITSNTATATMILPIMASLAYAINVHPFALMIPAALAASCAFMLPVATPPNAVVFASGKLNITDMVKAGFWVNVLGVVIIVLAVYMYLPIVFGIDLTVYPL